MSSIRQLLKFVLPISLLLIGCQPTFKADRGAGETHFSDGFLPAEEKEFTPLVVGKRDYEEQLKPVEVPQIVKDRQAEPQVETTEKEVLFEIKRPHLVIDVDKSVMEFSATIRTEQGDEEIQLQGPFKKNVAPWRADLYAADPKILNERRMQAVAICLTAQVCDVVGVDIYYKIDGKVHKKQYRSGVSGPRIAMSGHEEDEDQSSDEQGEPSQETEPVTEPGPEVVSPQTLPQGEVASTGSAEPAPTAEPKPVKPEPAKTKTTPAKKIQKKPEVKLEDLPPGVIQDKAVEWDGPIQMSLPGESPYRIPELPKSVEKPKTGDQGGEIPQAIGAHDSGYLKAANYVPPQGKGFVREVALKNPATATPEKDRTMAWGTQRMAKFVEAVGEKLDQTFSGARMVLRSISNRTGGKAGKHASHRTGLDVDIYYISKDPKTSSFYAVEKGRIVPEFDLEKNWQLMKSINSARDGWLIVIFTDTVIKQALCQYAKSKGENIDDASSLAYQTLRSLVHWDSHTDHAHVRLYCPKTEGCANKMVSLPKGTGCRF